jgi:hypothetical protein
MQNYRVLCSKETVKGCELCLILTPFLRMLREGEKSGYLEILILTPFLRMLREEAKSGYLEIMIIICGGY